MDVERQLLGFSRLSGLLAVQALYMLSCLKVSAFCLFVLNLLSDIGVPFLKDIHTQIYRSNIVCLLCSTTFLCLRISLCVLVCVCVCCTFVFVIAYTHVHDPVCLWRPEVNLWGLALP